MCCWPSLSFEHEGQNAWKQGKTHQKQNEMAHELRKQIANVLRGDGRRNHDTWRVRVAGKLKAASGCLVPFIVAILSASQPQNDLGRLDHFVGPVQDEGDYSASLEGVLVH